MTWLHTNDPADSERAAGTPAARTRATARLTGRVANSAAGPSSLGSDRQGLDDWGVDRRVNAAGGALALGHPWGASGAAAVVRAVHRLQGQPPGARAVVACAVAGGLGITMLLEVA